MSDILDTAPTALEALKSIRAERPAMWKQYGYPAHFVGAHKCRFHLCTRVGNYIVSTVGDYFADGKPLQPLGSGEDSLFETMVFDFDGEHQDGQPVVLTGNPLEMARYATPEAAQGGHEAYCRKMAALTQSELCRALIDSLEANKVTLAKLSRGANRD